MAISRVKKSDFAVSFNTTILKFGSKGEKTGWTYIEIPADQAAILSPGNKKSFRVKGMLDSFPIQGVALLPMGEGNFILPLNAAMRKGTGKRNGAIISVRLTLDPKKPVLNKILMECLADDADALAFFNQLSKSHQNYFSKWIDSAKTEETKAIRIARTLKALSKKMNYGQMLRAKE